VILISYHCGRAPRNGDIALSCHFLGIACIFAVPEPMPYHTNDKCTPPSQPITVWPPPTGVTDAPTEPISEVQLETRKEIKERQDEANRECVPQFLSLSLTPVPFILHNDTHDMHTNANANANDGKVQDDKDNNPDNGDSLIPLAIMSTSELSSYSCGMESPDFFPRGARYVDANGRKCLMYEDTRIEVCASSAHASHTSIMMTCPPSVPAVIDGSCSTSIYVLLYVASSASSMVGGLGTWQ
jgi:hypothetical protein